MEGKHTPGPWVADIRTGMFSIYPGEKHHGCLSEETPREVVRQLGKGDRFAPNSWLYLTEEQKANAHLIAAAPELLEACDLALEFVEGNDFSFLTRWGEVEDALRAAIAKARGEE